MTTVSVSQVQAARLRGVLATARTKPLHEASTPTPERAEALVADFRASRAAC
jgi:hypothetical protein